MVLAAHNYGKSGATDVRLIQRLEAIEAESYFDLYSSASPEVTGELGLRVYRSHGATATLATRTNVLALNRVGGIALYAELDPDWLQSLLRQFTEVGVQRAFFNRVPYSPDTHLDEKFKAAGLRYHNNWVKLHRDCSPLTGVECDLEVRPVTSTHAREFGQIFADAAGWPEAAGQLVAGLFGRPNWHAFGAFDGERLVATAALYARGDTGALTFAATRPEYRGRGAQQKLVQRRIEAAASLGCTLLSVETGQDRPGHSFPSYRNMLRCGFIETYVRGNYVWDNRDSV